MPGVLDALRFVVSCKQPGCTEALETLGGTVVASAQVPSSDPKGLYEVVDFDTHLDDPDKDWTGNAALYEQGK